MSASCWRHSPEVSFLHLLNPCLPESISYSVWFMKNGTRLHTESISPGEFRRQRWVPPAEYLRLHRIPGDLLAGPPAGSYSIQGFFQVNDGGESTEAGSLCSWGRKLKVKREINAGEELVSPHMWVTHGWSRPSSTCWTTPWTGNSTDPLSCGERHVFVAKHNMRPSKQVKGKWSSTKLSFFKF